ncbi:hypothetical protein PSTG_16262 [Puccinia striiformis f. sp. tritici PST-78]|uniref:Uncharacterized protein n=1 Tax=Puccinia striiformis f. sp. tritici PST-78 TaxID=1165861 RepID=A0A0L0UU30_9BASI|nr:hypothetical protein PSTG_16262 [Puccinia striiformis f. sp. tritici PST-78]
MSAGCVKQLSSSADTRNCPVVVESTDDHRVGAAATTKVLWDCGVQRAMRGLGGTDQGAIWGLAKSRYSRYDDAKDRQKKRSRGKHCHRGACRVLKKTMGRFGGCRQDAFEYQGCDRVGFFVKYDLVWRNFR